MLIKIKSRFNGSTIHEGDYISLMDAVASCARSRANLSGADLSGANLSGADLSGANLSRADLSGANLSRANLSRADLSGANLSRADLSGADLSGADLYGANLSGADLSGADLSGANLSGADLSGANLSRANLSGANLSRANLSRADLSGANLSRANLDQSPSHSLAVARTRILPDGEIVGWKKANGNLIVKLTIPADAKRSHAFGRKCRCEFAMVTAIYDGTNECLTATTCQHGTRTNYVVGELVKPDRFEDDWTKECAPGIHFFITRAEAEAYII